MVQKTGSRFAPCYPDSGILCPFLLNAFFAYHRYPLTIGKIKMLDAVVQMHWEHPERLFHRPKLLQPTDYEPEDCTVITSDGFRASIPLNIHQKEDADTLTEYVVVYEGEGVHLLIPRALENPDMSDSTSAFLEIKSFSELQLKSYLSLPRHLIFAPTVKETAKAFANLTTKSVATPYDNATEHYYLQTDAIIAFLHIEHREDHVFYTIEASNIEELPRYDTTYLLKVDDTVQQPTMDQLTYMVYSIEVAPWLSRNYYE